MKKDQFLNLRGYGIVGVVDESKLTRFCINSDEKLNLMYFLTIEKSLKVVDSSFGEKLLIILSINEVDLDYHS